MLTYLLHPLTKRLARIHDRGMMAMTYRNAFAPRTRLASACLAWLGMAVVLPPWSLDLRQA